MVPSLLNGDVIKPSASSKPANQDSLLLRAVRQSSEIDASRVKDVLLALLIASLLCLLLYNSQCGGKEWIHVYVAVVIGDE